MIKKIDKSKARATRKIRVRNKISGTSQRPRLNVFRSLKHIECQIIDDVKGHTLVSQNSKAKSLQAGFKDKNKTEIAYIVGQNIGKLAVEKGITKVIFDRAGYIYTGRIKALADGARSAGLEF